jgi:hypothetical protein
MMLTMSIDNLRTKEGTITIRQSTHTYRLEMDFLLLLFSM